MSGLTVRVLGDAINLKTKNTDQPIHPHSHCPAHPDPSGPQGWWWPAVVVCHQVDGWVEKRGEAGHGQSGSLFSLHHCNQRVERNCQMSQTSRSICLLNGIAVLTLQTNLLDKIRTGIALSKSRSVVESGRGHHSGRCMVCCAWGFTCLFGAHLKTGREKTI